MGEPAAAGRGPRDPRRAVRWAAEPRPQRRAADRFDDVKEALYPDTADVEDFSYERLWYGGGSLRSAQWAGEHAMNFLTSNVVRAEESENFAEIQLSHVRRFREHHPILTDIAGALAPALGLATRRLSGRANAPGTWPGASLSSTGSGRLRRRGLRAGAPR